MADGECQAEYEMTAQHDLTASGRLARGTVFHAPDSAPDL
jgi:hypothetical protein